MITTNLCSMVLAAYVASSVTAGVAFAHAGLCRPRNVWLWVLAAFWEVTVWALAWLHPLAGIL